jgi:hypothetical protein
MFQIKTADLNGIYTAYHAPLFRAIFEKIMWPEVNVKMGYTESIRAKIELDWQHLHVVSDSRSTQISSVPSLMKDEATHTDTAHVIAICENAHKKSKK